jgi:hypothetical protein
VCRWPVRPSQPRPVKDMIRSRSSVMSWLSHSQITKVSHPLAARASMLRLSRATVPANFAPQNAGRVLGWYAKRHPLCWCQKQPCTKIAFLRPFITISGRPGRPRPCRR